MGPIAENLASTVGLLLASMGALGALELAIPLHARNAWNSAHLRPNLGLTSIALATHAVLNSAAVLTLHGFASMGWGLLNTVAVGATLSTAAVVLALDFAFYVSHVAMHKLPALWRYHRVHHSDPALDVTTTLRQHPGESLMRFVVILGAAAALGASPAAFAVYRLASALNALLEHANIRLPQWLDTALSWVTTWPNVHKVHHSRKATETDSNYGNLFSWWDRLFSTFTPARHAATLCYGLDGFDLPAQQTTAGLLVLPYTPAHAQARPEHVAAPG